MDELSRLCARMLGDGAGAAAARATPEAADGSEDRLERIRQVLASCRDLTPAERPDDPDRRTEASPTESSTAQAAAAPADAAGADTPDTGDPEADAAASGETKSNEDDLRAAVARELAAAAAGCSERNRALLALRDLLGLSHEEIGQVLAAPADEVTLGLAHARLALREGLRGPGPAPTPCPERERALRTITLRLDGESVSEADEDWLVEHLGMCDSCGRTHAALLEAAACYRAWPEPGEAPDRASQASG